jgi:hypothetical protein
MNGRIVRLLLLIGFYVLWCGTLLAQERWVYRYNGPGNSWDGTTSITTDVQGNIYAAGSSVGSGTSSDIVVLSLTSSGAERWVYRYDGPEHDYDAGRAVVVGQDGNLYVAGTVGGQNDSQDMIVVSLTPQGTERWVYRHGGSGSSRDEANSIAMGGDGNLYAAGTCFETGSGNDLAVVSLTPSGNERWVYLYNGPTNGADGGRSISAGAEEDNSVYVAGESRDSVQWDLVIVSLSPDGSENWVYSYDGPGNWSDDARAIATGSDGNIYAAGASVGAGTDCDFVVVSLAPSGGERWVYRYDGHSVITATFSPEDSAKLIGGTETSRWSALLQRGQGVGCIAT